MQAIQPRAPRQIVERPRPARALSRTLLGRPLRPQRPQSLTLDSHRLAHRRGGLELRLQDRLGNSNAVITPRLVCTSTGSYVPGRASWARRQRLANAFMPSHTYARS
jgi:hypothetical protein